MPRHDASDVKKKDTQQTGNTWKYSLPYSSLTLVVSLSGWLRVLPFQVPLPLIQIGIGALLAWPTFGLHVEFDPELFLVLFIPPLLFCRWLEDANP